MKKILLIALVVLGGVSTASAWNYLKGTFNNWQTSADYCLDNGPVAVYLEASQTPYEFGIDYDGNWAGPKGNANITTTTTVNSFSGMGNFTLTVSTNGYYVFSTNWDNSLLSLTVRYPNTTVYFYNSLGWSDVYLHDGYWNGNNGASNVNALRGIKMTAGANNIYSAYVPSESFQRVTFTSDKQVNNGNDQYGAGYDNFYSTNVVWNASQFNSSTPIYVPTTTVSETLNNCSYYYGGSWHAYPTYTRNVTSGNFGTICLPFAATVTGADVYKIAGKVVENGELKAINLNKVTGTLQAGHAYIFKATEPTLTATFSGAYAEAIEADGMIGNLSADNIVVPVNQRNFVVSDNQIHEVVSSDYQGRVVTCGQYRAYITLNGIGEAKARGANFIGLDESTGIESVQANNQPTAMFNLQGQRVTDAQKGLVIVNGKKMLRK